MWGSLCKFNYLHTTNAVMLTKCLHQIILLIIYNLGHLPEMEDEALQGKHPKSPSAIDSCLKGKYPDEKPHYKGRKAYWIEYKHLVQAFY